MMRQSSLNQFLPGIKTSPTGIDEHGNPLQVKVKRKKIFTNAVQLVKKRNVSELYNQNVSPEECILRRKELDLLYEKMHDKTDLPLTETLGVKSKFVTDRGCVDAALMIVGEAPGANEAIEGKPFIGASGKLLDEFLTNVGISPTEHVFITNLVKIRPPGNRDPSYEEIQAWIPFLQEQIDIIKPRMILCLGRLASTVMHVGLHATVSIKGDEYAQVQGHHEIKAINMNGLYQRKANAKFSLYQPEKRACYRTYFAYHPSALLFDKDGTRGTRDRWTNDFVTIAKLLMRPALKYLNEIDFLGELDPNFPFTKQKTQFYDRHPLTIEEQMTYLDTMPSDKFEMQVHQVDHFAWRGEFEIFGRTRDRRSVHLTVQSCQTHFFVGAKDVDSWNIVLLQDMATAMLVEKGAAQAKEGQSVWVKIELSLQRSSHGYHPQLKNYVLVTCSHAKHTYDLWKMFSEMYPKCKSYQLNFKPILHFLLDRDTYLHGWLLMSRDAIRQPTTRLAYTDLEFSINWDRIFGLSPSPGEAGDPKYEELGEVRLLSTDFEVLSLEGFPDSDQNPVICMNIYTQRYNQGQLILEELRDPKDDTRVAPTGRSNYDAAVVFAVGSVSDIDVEKFSLDTLPNPPKIPSSHPIFSEGCIEGKYSEDYTIAIREWNEYIDRFADWIIQVGTSRLNIVYYNQELRSSIQSLTKRPDGLESQWPESKCLEWEAHISFIHHFDKDRYTDDIRMLSDVLATTKIDALREAGAHEALIEPTIEGHEGFYGRIQHRWALFRKHKTVYCFESEIKMHSAYARYFKQYDPDIITGWNVENFDLNFYVRRIQLLDIRDKKTGKLISLGRIAGREDYITNKTSKTRAHGERDFTEVHIPGRDVLDLLNVFLNETYGKYDSHTLASISEEVLGDTKHDVPYTAIPSLFKNNRVRLNDYCLKDAELPVMLINYLSTMIFLVTFTQLIGTIKVGRLNVEGQQAKIDAGLMRKQKTEGLRKITPDINPFSAGCAPCGLIDSEGYLGALVFPPIIGLLILLVWVLDFASLYPNIIRDNNFGEDTMGTAKQWRKLGIDPDTQCTKTLKEYMNPKTGEKEYYYFLIPRKLFAHQLSTTGYTIDECIIAKKKALNVLSGKEEVQYIPKIDVATVVGSLTEGLNDRAAIKKRMNQYTPREEMYKILNCQQESRKIRNNSTYGAYGVTKGKHACKPISESVTLIGQRMVQKMADDLKRVYNVTLVGGDTDSVFVIFPKITYLNQVYEPYKTAEGKTTCFADEIEHFINDDLSENSSVKLEKCYWPEIHVAKKRAMYIEHLPYYDKIKRRQTFDGVGSIKSKGLETARRDSCTIAKDTLSGFGEKLLTIAKTGDVEEAKKQAIAFAKEQVAKVDRGEINFHEMIETRKVTSSSYTNTNMAHLMVAKKMEARGDPPVALGTRVPFIIVTGRRGIKKYQAAENPRWALEHGLMPDLEHIRTKIYKPIARFCNTFSDGKSMLKKIFGRKMVVHKSNLLEDEPLARYAKPLIHCASCNDLSYEQLCPECKPKANYWKIHQERAQKHFTLSTEHAKRMKVCRTCMHIGTAEEVICENTACKEYFPRIAAQYGLNNFNKATQAIADIEDLFSPKVDSMDL